MKNNHQNLPTKEEVLQILNRYKEHKRQWQEKMYKRYEEEKAMTMMNCVAEDMQPYGNA